MVSPTFLPARAAGRSGTTLIGVESTAVMTSLGCSTADADDGWVHVPSAAWARQRLSTTTPPSVTVTG